MARKITDEDLANRGVMGLPDVPGLTAIEMQKKLEEIPREVIIPRYNELVDSVADICDEFNKLNSYAVGDYCIYQNKLYKCNTATNGDWDASKWTETSVGDELKSVNSNLSELQSVDITPVSNNYAAVNTSGTYAYIKNGICYLQITINGTASYSGWVNIAKLQIQLDTGGKELYFPAIDTSAQKANSIVRIIGDGKVYCTSESGAALYANVSFPCKLTI